jgi:hypothetical protein
MLIGRQEGRTPASLDNARTPLGRNRGLKRPSIGRLAANSRTAPDAAFGFPAKQCAAVACSANPSRLSRRDRFAGRWFGGGRRTRSSSGTRPAYQHSCQSATRGRSEDAQNNDLRHHLCVIYLTETCCRQNNSIRISKVNFNSSLLTTCPKRSPHARLRASTAVASAPRNLRSPVFVKVCTATRG